MPPSPVVVLVPTALAPRPSASLALAERAPNDIPAIVTGMSMCSGLRASNARTSIRGVMFAYAAPGIAAAVLLGLGRAFGEAIAVNQTIGNHNGIPSSWFQPGDSLGSKVASEYVGATSLEQASSILYLAAILMVISLATNVVAQFIVVRFEKARRAV